MCVLQVATQVLCLFHTHGGIKWGVCWEPGQCCALVVWVEPFSPLFCAVSASKAVSNATCILFIDQLVVTRHAFVPVLRPIICFFSFCFGFWPGGFLLLSPLLLLGLACRFASSVCPWRFQQSSEVSVCSWGWRFSGGGPHGVTHLREQLEIRELCYTAAPQIPKSLVSSLVCHVCVCASSPLCVLREGFRNSTGDAAMADQPRTGGVAGQQTESK